MKQLIILLGLFLIFSCKSDENVFSCIRFGESVGHLDLYCANFTGLLSETCPNSFSKDIPEKYLQVADIITHLKYSGCSKETILNMTNLRSIDISQSSYDSLGSIKLNHQYLENFNASHNSIRNVPVDFFTSTPNLTTVDLSYNKIGRIDERTFVHAKNLEYINLSNNLIEFQGGFWLRAPNVKAIHMENNPFVVLNCQLITLAKNGAMVHVSFKNLISIGNDCLNDVNIVLRESELLMPAPYGKVTLQCNEMSFERLWGSFRLDFTQCFSSNTNRLDLHGNLHGQLNQETFQRFVHLNELDLSDTQLREFDFVWLKNNQQIETLKLSNNKLKSLQNPQILRMFEHLTVLDLTGNQIKNTREVIYYLSPMMRRLNVRGNLIGKLDANAFEKLEQLEGLDIRNTGLSFDGQSPFEPLQNLRTLLISNNNFDGLDFPIPSKPLDKLLIFHAVNCHIANATKLTKFLPSSLQQLDLTGNFLGEIETNTFETTPHLMHLHLENTNLRMAEWNAFNHMQELKVLDISDNSLENVYFAPTSPPLGSLMRLYARNCSLKNLSGLLGVLPAIKELDLSYNNLNEIGADTFIKSEYLKFLRLRHTNLTTFDFNTINDRMYLDLDLSFNHLQQVDLTPLKYVGDLNLEGNDLVEIDTLHEPEMIDMNIMIANNQFSCEYLMAFMERVKQFKRLKIGGDLWKQKHRKNCQRKID